MVSPVTSTTSTGLVTGHAATCSGLQVPGDVYSPPCESWSGGNNGGATSLGVTATTVTLGLRETAIMDIASVVGALTGQQVQGAASPSDVVRTYQVLAQFFNDHFQFYGRKLVIKVFQGQGSPATEILGGGQANATSDAIDEAQQLGAFADVSIEAPVFAQALINQKVIATNPTYPPQSFYAQNAPYAWGFWPDCNKVEAMDVDFALKYLKGQPAVYAGGSLKGQPRKLGLIYGDSAASCGTEAVQQLAAGGLPVADARSYPVDISTLQQSAQTITSAFASEGITTVLDMADPITTFFMTNYANEDHWTPEWLESGAVFDDTDWAGQLFNQAEWSHAFGPSTSGSTQAARASSGYAAYESESPTTTPAESSVQMVYDTLELVAIGIQMAGPDLTPGTFAQGLHGYQSAGTGADGDWAFPSGSYTAPQDARIVWWNPSATSVYNGAMGAYASNDARSPIGDFPAGAPPIFTNASP